MYIETVPNRNSRPAILLREAWREGKKIRKRTLANLTHWQPEKVARLRAALQEGGPVQPAAPVRVRRSLPHGHVAAVLTAIRRLGLPELLASRRCRERDLVVGMIAERLLHASSKLATARLWSQTTLAEELGVADASVEELYGALDWLLARQDRLERKLARRHLQPGGLVLYDLTSSSYEGRTCPLACWGHNRDGDKLPCIAYGVLTDGEGRPVAVSVYPGNTGDPKTVGDQVDKLRERFGLERVVLVGDRGMLTQARLRELRQYPGLGWISALRSSQIRELVALGRLSRSLFDEQDLAEVVAPEEYPGERLVACYNPLLADERRRTRDELLAVAEAGLARVAAEIGRRTRTLLGTAAIGLKAGRVLEKTKMKKHFLLEIGEGQLTWRRNEASIRQEAELDGIYVVRTSEARERLPAPATVRGYKSLAQVERAFRTFKGVDLLVRPIWHREPDRVRAHILLCLLAYYVEWHLRRALAPLLFDDEELPERRHSRPPVGPAQPSQAARRKKALRQTPEGLPVHSFETLLEELGTQARVELQIGDAPDAPIVTQIVSPTPIQQRAGELLATIAVPSNA